MARKEYTQGDVIGIIGRLIGKVIEAIGFGIFLGAKILGRISASISWMVGKQVDMTNTIKEMNAEKREAEYELQEDNAPPLPLQEPELESKARGRSIRAERSTQALLGKRHEDTAETLLVSEPMADDSMNLETVSKIKHAANEFNIIRQALDYGEKAYKSDLLPTREILRIDKQALIMAKATLNILKDNSNSSSNGFELKMAEALVNACSCYEQYHATDNARYRKKAQEYLLRAGVRS